MERSSDGKEGLGAGPAPAAGIQAVIEEIRSTRVTAEQMAHDGPSPGADVPRVLAGLLAHLAEQVERLGGLLTAPPSATVSSPRSGMASSGRPSSPSDDQAGANEEDITPEDAPAEPRRDPNAEGRE
jgi:hypothetical protein